MRIENNACVDKSLDGLDSNQQKRLVEILESRWKNPSLFPAQERQRLIEENSDLGSYLIDALGGLEWLSPAGLTWEETHLERKQIGGFEIEKELGRGGMGIVYAARRLADNQEVAIKVLPKHTTSSSKLERFQREAKAASAVQHPSIVPVFESGFDQDIYFFSMKRIDGDSLSNWILNRNQQNFANLDIDSCRDLAREFSSLADGLYQVHRSGILHRDIKPSNILIDQTGHLWIFDFGLAYVFDGDVLTRTGDLLGTFRYMSPEQAKGGSEFLDVRTDIYSLGLSLYEALTGHHPFESLEGSELLNAIRTQEPTPPSKHWASIPRDLETIVMRAIRPDKNTRYATAKELSQDLFAFSQGESISAKRVTILERSRCLIAKYPERLLLGVCALGISTLGLGVHSALLQKQKQETLQQWERGNVNFEQARNAVDTLGFEVASKLATIPGTEELQKDVFRETLQYYNNFLQRSSNDPSLDKDAAITHWKIARLIHVSGNREEFRSSMDDAIMRLESTWNVTHDVEILSLSIQASVELAWDLIEQGEWGESNLLLEKAEKLLSQFALSSERRMVAALVNNARATYSFRRGDQTRAIALSKETLELLSEEYPAEDLQGDNAASKKDNRILQATADALSNLAVILTNQDEYDLASQAISRSISLQKNQLGSKHSRNLAVSLNNLASLQWRQGQIQLSIESYRECVSILQASLEQYPGLIGPRKELAIALNNLGLALSKRGNYFDASDSFEKSTSLITTIADTDSSDLDALKQAAGIWNNFGTAKANVSEINRAMEAFDKAIHYQTQATNQSPNTTEEKRILLKYRENKNFWNSARTSSSAAQSLSQYGAK
jgi:tetratricopeptide (TPR) repeat protein